MSEELTPTEIEVKDNPIPAYEDAIKDDCMGEKIRKLIDEGKPQDQAVAIAYSVCGEEKAKAESLKTNEISDEANATEDVIATSLEIVYFAGGKIKALEATPTEAKIGGYLVVWGSPEQRDTHGEYFTQNTDLGLDWYKDRPVLYHHGLDETVKADPIGTVIKLVKDEIGVWAEAILDLTKPYASAVLKMIKRGLLGWSSGSMPHLVHTNNDGQIVKWPIAEASLTPTPAEPHRTAVQAIRAAIKTLEENTSALDTEVTDEPKEPMAKVETSESEVDSALNESNELNLKPKRKNEMLNKPAVKSWSGDIIAAGESAKLTPEQILALLKALPDNAAPDETNPDDAYMADDKPSPAAPNPDDAYMAKAVETMTPKQYEAFLEKAFQYMRTAPANRELPAVETELPTKARHDIQVYSPYESLSAEDMSYLIHMRTLYSPKLNQGWYQPDVKMVRELTTKTQTAIKAGQINFGLERDLQGLTLNQRIMAVKTNELDNTGVAAAAGNWVPELWSNQLWNRVRLPNRVAGQFQVVEMPSATYDLPVEDADPTVSFVPETTNDTQLSLASGAAIPDSLVSAGKVQLVAKKFALRVGFSVEMMEDSIIQFIPQLRNQAMWAMENAIDYVLLNGDTTNSSANINYAGSGPAATDRFMAFAGMRYLSLITNAAANAIPINASGASPTLQMIRQARFAMISTLNTYGIEPENLFIACDPFTYGRMLNIDELLSYFNNGRDSTVNTGVVPNVDGIPVIPTSQLALTTTTGKTSGTAADNVYGTIVIGAKNGWKVGYRRNITASLDFLPYYDAYQLTMTLRLAFKNKDNYVNNVIYGLATS